MRRPRTLVQIPSELAAEIDKLVGQGHRTLFIVDLVERELRRRRQLEAIQGAAGSWKDEDHPELAGGAESWIREMRHEAALRLAKIDRQP